MLKKKKIPQTFEENNLSPLLVKINRVGCVLYIFYQHSIGYNIPSKRKYALKIFQPTKFLFRAKAAGKHFQTCKNSETIATQILPRKAKQNKKNLAYQEMNLKTVKKNTGIKNPII